MNATITITLKPFILFLINRPYSFGLGKRANDDDFSDNDSMLYDTMPMIFPSNNLLDKQMDSQDGKCFLNFVNYL